MQNFNMFVAMKNKFYERKKKQSLIKYVQATSLLSYFPWKYWMHFVILKIRQNKRMSTLFCPSNIKTIKNFAQTVNSRVHNVSWDIITFVDSFKSSLDFCPCLFLFMVFNYRCLINVGAFSYLYITFYPKMFTKNV